VQPIGMVPTHRVGVRREPSALSISLSGVREVGFERFRIFIWIDEFLPRVVGRVYVDHLDFAEIRLLQELHDFKVVTLNEDIARCVKIRRFAATRLQRRLARLLNDFHTLRLARPYQSKAFRTSLDPLTKRAP